MDCSDNNCKNCVYAAPCNHTNGVVYCEIDKTYLKVIPVECHAFVSIDL